MIITIKSFIVIFLYHILFSIKLIFIYIFAFMV